MTHWRLHEPAVAPAGDVGRLLRPADDPGQRRAVPQDVMSAHDQAPAAPRDAWRDLSGQRPATAWAEQREAGR